MEQQRSADIKAAALKGEMDHCLSKKFDKALDNHVARQLAATRYDYGSLVAMIEMGSQPMISYVHYHLTGRRSDTVKLLKAARLFDPLFTSRTFGFHR